MRTSVHGAANHARTVDRASDRVGFPGQAIISVGRGGTRSRRHANSEAGDETPRFRRPRRLGCFRLVPSGAALFGFKSSSLPESVLLVTPGEDRRKARRRNSRPSRTPAAEAWGNKPANRPTVRTLQVLRDSTFISQASQRYRRVPRGFLRLPPHEAADQQAKFSAEDDCLVATGGRRVVKRGERDAPGGSPEALTIRERPR